MLADTSKSEAGYYSMLDQLHFATSWIVDGEKHMFSGLKAFKTVYFLLEVAIRPRRVSPFSDDAN